MKISDFIQSKDIILDLAVSTKLRALQLLSAKAADLVAMDGALVFNALNSREALGSTGIGDGIAIPHARLPGIAQPFGLLARLSKAIDFESIDDIPVDLIFVLILPENKRGENLNVLACIARRMRSEATVKAVRTAASADDVYSMLDSEPV